ncbi:PREDICTED: uncharacterized protein LOC109589641 [Amphimedon queenslandica]|uniref:Death domain-containing protein n=2 Tax=Amphimedon queenslandica TaxID=400682 RepID=A0AAN0JW13_AMPQE|nr:PREDICTED: uncharacterized protein LOC109589641 [Amphimedon queenslandica]|eukprot:XP_019861259.1 PREDICTED: uncharacterized protein LOC109589641 [Amphimedon queenslandica]
MIADDTEVVERNILIKFGLFGEALLEKIAKKQKILNDDFRLSHMIDLLVHLHIIAEVRVNHLNIITEDVDFEKEKVHVVTDVKSNKEKIKYFFPCALPSYDKLNPALTEIQPLLIAWEIKYSGTTTLAIPQGLFPLTIVHLLERKKEEVDFSPDRDSHKFYRYHDAMSLRVYERYFIDIINRYTHLEIHFRGYKKSYSQIVAEVRELLRKVMEKSSKNLKVEEDTKFIFAFKCPEKGTYCIVREKDKSKGKASTWCTECVSQCNVLDLENDDSYRCWFSDQLSSPGNKFASLEGQDPPTKKCGVQHTELDTSNLIHILDILKKHGYSGVDYYYLGLRLGLLPRTLDVIEEESKGNVRNGLRECLKAWLEQKDNVKSVGGPTYDTLIQALRDEEENAVADGIEKDINTKK